MQERHLAILTIFLSLYGALGFAMYQGVDASNAIAVPGTSINATATNGTISAIPFDSNATLGASNASEFNVTLLDTNAIVNTDPVTFSTTMQVIGEIFNNGTKNINNTDLVIPATLYDVNGTIVGTFSAIPEMLAVEANNSSPFKITFFDTDVKDGVLNAMFYKVQAANETVFGLVPIPPPLALGAGIVGGGIPGGVPFGFPPLGPMMGLPPLAPIPLFPAPILPPTLNRTLPNQTNPVITNQTLPTNQTQPTNQTLAREQPDESCLFDVTQPRCLPDENGQCPEGFFTNEDQQCFPQHEQCPDGYHGQEDDETGQCYPDSRSCDEGYILSPDFPECMKKETVCKQHPELNQCTDLIIAQEALTSTDDEKLTNTTSGQEQEETEEESQGKGTSSILSGQSITGIQQEQQQEPSEQESDQEGEESNEEDNAEEEKS
jgi:hypothetical protein